MNELQGTACEQSVSFITPVVTSSRRRHPMTAPEISTIHWRTSSFSGNNGTCVEVAALPDGHIALRNSTHRDDGTILFTHAELNAWISGVKDGEFDDLAS